MLYNIVLLSATPQQESVIDRYMHVWASQVAQVVKNLPVNEGVISNESSIPGLRRAPGGGHYNSLQNSCLENHQGQKSLVSYSP